MSAYCDSDDIALEAKVSGSFDSTTLPTADKVEDIIEEVSAEIDVFVTTKYRLPLVQQTNILVLKSIAIALAASRVRSIIESNSGGGGHFGKPEHILAAEAARKRLVQISDGTVQFDGETLKTTADGVRSYASDNNLQPTFRRDVEQW